MFADDEARAALNAIVHPRVRDAAQRLEQGVAPGSVVLHVIPLLVEAGLADGFGHIVVVDVPEELQLSRLMARNGFTVEQAKARIDAQATRAKRLEVATWVIDNSGPMDATARQVDALWAGPIAEIRSAPGPSA